MSKVLRKDRGLRKVARAPKSKEAERNFAYNNVKDNLREGAIKAFKKTYGEQEDK